MKIYDAIVVGVGGIGSAAIYHLARRGVRVVGIDRFAPPHDRGSTHGQSRVIRQAYFEHPAYVPLLLESYQLWRQLERASGRALLHEVGLLEVGPADGIVVPGVLRAADEHGLAVERLSPNEIEQRWPGMRVADNHIGVFEQAGGYLLVEDCVETHLKGAQAAGADLLLNTGVHEWSANDREVHVQTTNGEVVAKRLILAAGAWARGLLADVKLDLRVRRKSLFWFDAPRALYGDSAGFPVYLFELSTGIYYGFPQLDARGVKIAEHSGGRDIDDPLAVDRAIDAGEQRRLIEFATAHLPGVSSRVVDHSVCLYTMSPDEHFIVDRHPLHANVVYAAGLSGHGFKFAPALGQALAELAVEGESTEAIEFLRAGRFG